MNDAEKNDFVIGNDGKNLGRVEYAEAGTILLNTKYTKIDLASLMLQMFEIWSASHKREARNLRKQIQSGSITRHLKGIDDNLDSQGKWLACCVAIYQAFYQPSMIPPRICA